MIRKRAYLVLSVLLSTLTLAQSQIAPSPTDSHLANNAYINTFFKFSYPWPQGFRPVDIGLLNHPQTTPLRNEFLLFSASEPGGQSAAQNGTILLAESTKPTPHNLRGFPTASDFLDFVIRSFKPEEHLNILRRAHLTGPGGLVFDQLDYDSSGQHSSAVVTRIGDFLIVFKCTARSPSDLALMFRAALASRRTQ